MPQSLSRFLVEHERCGAGFDLAHPAGVGSGLVKMTCRGCGATHEYAGASIEPDRERQAQHPDQRSAATGASARRGAMAGHPRHARRRDRTEQIVRRRRLAAGLAAVAIAAVALAVIVIADGSDPDERASSGVGEAPAGEAPAEEGAGAPNESEPPPAAAAADELRPLAGASLIRTRTFVIKLPQGWRQATGGGRLLLRPAAGSSATVQVFFELEPDLNLERMRRQTANFLRRRSSDARITTGKRLRVDGNRGFSISALGADRTERAIGVANGPVRYLLLRSVRDGAPASLRRQALAVEASFSPR
jgi:hypothetical protein